MLAVYLVAMPLPAAFGRETRLFVNNEYVTELCMRNVLPSVFLAKEVIESESKTLYFSKKPLPYSCHTSIRTESGSHLIVVMITKGERESSCRRYSQQMVVYPLDERVKRYWAKLPPGVTHPPPDNHQNYRSTTEVDEEPTKMNTYTSPKPMVGYKHYLVEEIPIVNLTVNVEEGIFYEEFDDDDKKGEHKNYLIPTDIPIANVSLIDEYMLYNTTAAEPVVEPEEEDRVEATSKGNLRDDSWSQAPSAQTQLEYDKRSQSDVVGNGSMPNNNISNDDHDQHDHRKHGEMRMNLSVVQNKIELLPPYSTDSTSFASSTSNEELKNDSPKESTSSNILLLGNHPEIYSKVTPLNTKWWDWRTFTRVTKNKILFEKEVSTDEIRKTTPITQSQFNNSGNADESGLSRLPQKVSHENSLIEINDDDSREHLARIWQEGTPVFNQTVVDREETVTRYTTSSPDATPDLGWNLIQQDNLKSRIFHQMEIENGIYRRNERGGKKRSPEDDAEDSEDEIIDTVVSEENLGIYIDKPILDICGRGNDKQPVRNLVGVANSSRILLRLVNFSVGFLKQRNNGDDVYLFTIINHLFDYRKTLEII